ncbi:hypothetical protein GCM10027292_28780 [Hydrogenophaga aquatica]
MAQPVCQRQGAAERLQRGLLVEQAGVRVAQRDTGHRLLATLAPAPHAQPCPHGHGNKGHGQQGKKR